MDAYPPQKPVALFTLLPALLNRNRGLSLVSCLDLVFRFLKVFSTSTTPSWLLRLSGIIASLGMN